MKDQVDFDETAGCFIISCPIHLGVFYLFSQE